MKYIVNEGQILHITHNDSDALGCSLVVEYYRMQENYKSEDSKYSYLPIHNFNSVESANQKIELINSVLTTLFMHTHTDNYEFDIPDDILTKFKELTNGYNYNDMGMLSIPGIIIVSDLAVDITKIGRLYMLCNDFKIDLIYVDHHTSNLINHNPMRGLYIQSTDDNNIPRSACKYLFDILKDDDYKTSIINNYDAFYNLINDISRYDTWLWKTNPINNDENYTTILITEIGSIYEAFESIRHHLLYKENITDGLMDIDQFSILIENSINRQNQTIKKYMKNVVYDNGCNLGFQENEYINAKFALIILPENFGNNIMEEIYTNYDHPIDVVIGLYPSSRQLTFRRSRTCDIDLSKLASIYGGGGHVSASGATLDTYTFIRFIKYYYDLLDKKNK